MSKSRVMSRMCDYMFQAILAEVAVSVSQRDVAAKDSIDIMDYIA